MATVYSPGDHSRELHVHMRVGLSEDHDEKHAATVILNLSSALTKTPNVEREVSIPFNDH